MLVESKTELELGQRVVFFKYECICLALLDNTSSPQANVQNKIYSQAGITSLVQIYLADDNSKSASSFSKESGYMEFCGDIYT